MRKLLEVLPTSSIGNKFCFTIATMRVPAWVGEILYRQKAFPAGVSPTILGEVSSWPDFIFSMPFRRCIISSSFTFFTLFSICKSFINFRKISLVISSSIRWWVGVAIFEFIDKINSIAPKRIRKVSANPTTSPTQKLGGARCAIVNSHHQECWSFSTSREVSN